MKHLTLLSFGLILENHSMISRLSTAWIAMRFYGNLWYMDFWSVSGIVLFISMRVCFFWWRMFYYLSDRLCSSARFRLGTNLILVNYYWCVEFSHSWNFRCIWGCTTVLWRGECLRDLVRQISEDLGQINLQCKFC